MAAIDEYRQAWYHILPQIQCPVLFVRAKDSWCLSEEEAEKMRKLIKDCTYFEVTNSDHMVYADNPDEFYPRFDQFLSRL
jgi:pimeloyl-ACP methyl ester carboxylesterase